MTAATEILESFRTRIGEVSRKRLGTLGATEIRRYARATGDENPLHHDTEYARSRGYADIVAPPNMIPSIMEWGGGEGEEYLRPDGTTPDEFSGVADDARVMGGGEAMVFHRRVVAGTEIHSTSKLVEAYEKEGWSGRIVFLVYDNDYADAAGEPLLTCRRTVLLR